MVSNRPRALTERIIETYEDCGPIHHLGHSSPPSGHEAAAILTGLRELLYPGYSRRQNLHPGNIASPIGDLIEHLLNRRRARPLRL